MRRATGLLLTLLLTASCGGNPFASTTPTPPVSSAPPASPTSTDVPPSLWEHGTATIDTGGQDVLVDVEIALTDAAQERGLMHRTELADDAGMIFVFAEESPRAFWMKNTLIPLSIAFYDADGDIVSILDMEPCEADPCPLYESGAPAQGALEVNLGFFADHGVEMGDRISYTTD